jgi:hypothetical protein
MPVNIFTTINDSLAADPSGTVANGINDAGLIVGQFSDGSSHGFLLSVATPTTT